MLPLEGIKVVEMGIWAAGPSAGVVLADWGADVIKIEDPANADPMRALALLFGLPVDNFNPVFEVDNRNKRSVAINLKTESGRAIAYELIKGADVFLSNMREKALESLGLGYENLAALNSRLIYAHLAGYGPRGEEADKAAYDTGAYWARGGFMAQLGEEGASPVIQAMFGLGDQPTGALLAGGIALALYVRERTGKGQRVDTSLLASAVWTQSLNLMITMAARNTPGMPQEFPRHNRANTRNPLNAYYKTKDGKYLLLLMLQPDRYWSEFCRLLGIQQHENDPRFATFTQRVMHAAELVAILDAVFATRTRAEWIEVFKGTTILYDPVHTFAEVVEDPQVLANEYLVDFEHPRAGKIRVPRTPVHLNGMLPAIRTHAPEAGEHTESVLLEMGYDWDKIIRLKEEGAIL
jgi:crotonobetainyl-CoA:carnitine CoA-transferase CaiB-like acyl-CoA transferase